MTRHQQIKQFISDQRKLRAEASKGEWNIVKADDYPTLYDEQHLGCCGVEVPSNEHSICYPEGRLSQNNAHFIASAANNYSALLDALDCAVDTLEQIESGNGKMGDASSAEIKSLKALSDIGVKLGVSDD